MSARGGSHVWRRVGRHEPPLRSRRSLARRRRWARRQRGTLDWRTDYNRARSTARAAATWTDVGYGSSRARARGGARAGPCRVAGVPDKDGDRDGVAIHPSIRSRLGLFGLVVAPAYAGGPGDSSPPLLHRQLWANGLFCLGLGCLLLERLPLDGGRPARRVTHCDAVSDRPASGEWFTGELFLLVASSEGEEFGACLRRSDIPYFPSRFG